MEASAKSAESFQQATSFSMGDLSLLIAGIVCMAIFVWSAWVAMAHYEQWAQGKNNVSLFDVMWGSIRSILLLSLVLFIVT